MDYDAFRGCRNWTPTRPRPAHLQGFPNTRIEIESADGTKVFQPTSLMMAAATGELDSALIVSPDRRSVISGAPAVLYRTDEAEIALTPAEVVRLTQRTLSPKEFTAICDAVGAIWEVHCDFYDPDSGLAKRAQERPI